MKVGARVHVRGTAGKHRGQVAIINPEYEFVE